MKLNCLRDFHSRWTRGAAVFLALASFGLTFMLPAHHLRHAPNGVCGTQLVRTASQESVSVLIGQHAASKSLPSAEHETFPEDEHLYPGDAIVANAISRQKLRLSVQRQVYG